jgi:hypothetical protein
MEFETLRMQIADFQGSHTVRIKEVDGEVRVLRKILKLLDGMPDTRVQGRITYPLGDLVLMLFLATLAGSDSCLGAADFWMHNARLYKRLFGREAVPSHDTLRRVLAIIRPGDLNGLLVGVPLSTSQKAIITDLFCS